jgi:hypothetical protein
VRRTRQELGYFTKPLEKGRVLSDDEKQKVDQQFDIRKMEMTQEERDKYIYTNSDPFADVLFLYAKLNPGINYVQGMNEVLAMIYYCFMQDEEIFDHEQSLADSFGAFSSIMEVMRDPFLRELDKEQSGLEGHINHYDQILEFIDPEIYEVITENNVPH